MTLLEHLSKLEDPRRKEGVRTKLPELLTMVILGYLCGHIGYRSIARFCRNNQKVLTEYLSLKHPTPSYETIRFVLNSIDYKDFIKCFNTWAVSLYPEKEFSWISGDGKALGSTLTTVHNKSQNFEALVSLFATESELVLYIKSYANKNK